MVTLSVGCSQKFLLKVTLNIDIHKTERYLKILNITVNAKVNGSNATRRSRITVRTGVPSTLKNIRKQCFDYLYVLLT